MRKRIKHNKMKPATAPTAMKTVPLGALVLQIYGLSYAAGGVMVGVVHNAEVAEVAELLVVVIFGIPVAVVVVDMVIYLWLKGRINADL
jgi:hypothetical protein